MPVASDTDGLTVLPVECVCVDRLHTLNIHSGIHWYNCRRRFVSKLNGVVPCPSCCLSFPCLSLPRFLLIVPTIPHPFPKNPNPFPPPFLFPRFSLFVFGYGGWQNTENEEICFSCFACESLKVFSFGELCHPGSLSSGSAPGLTGGCLYRLWLATCVHCAPHAFWPGDAPGRLCVCIRSYCILLASFYWAAERWPCFGVWLNHVLEIFW